LAYQLAAADATLGSNPQQTERGLAAACRTLADLNNDMTSGLYLGYPSLFSS